MLLTDRARNGRVNMSYLINLSHDWYDKIKYCHLYELYSKHLNCNINHFDYKQYWQAQFMINLNVNISVAILNRD